MSEPFIAEIKIIAWNYAPKGWAFCNGQLLPINQNQALFSILGTTYGGNGQTTFALPDMRGRSPLHTGNGFVLGQKAGEENHTITINELPAHTHVVRANSAGVNSGFTNNNTWAPVNGSNIFGSAPDSAMDPTVVTTTGGSQPHPNLQPYLVLNFVIALQGIFPSQN